MIISSLKHKGLSLAIIVLTICRTSAEGNCVKDCTEEDAVKYLETLETRYSAACNRAANARWEYATNITTETSARSTLADEQFMKLQSWIQYDILTMFPDWRDFKNKWVKRQLKYLSIYGPATMSDEHVAKMTLLHKGMETAYSTATVCDFHNKTKCDLRLDPEIEKIMKTSRSPEELAHYWNSWHDTMSSKVPPSMYREYVIFLNEMAQANGFEDMSDMWMIEYDDETNGWTPAGFRKQMFNLWEKVKPMFTKLHAYVRMKLRRLPEYKEIMKDKCGYIPAHILGNMWAQDWSSINDITKPFPNVESEDATKAMMKQNYTSLRMFQEADKFFTNLGLIPMTETFWKKSMLERPSDGRDVTCHASAHDFCLGKHSTDFRIKQCTKVDASHLVTAHHEMGHTQYHMQYSNLSTIFRGGAHPGFHEAIGDSLALAVMTPKHLQCVLGLDLQLDPSLCSENGTMAGGKVSEADINFLFRTALSKIVVLPFTISVDSWRWTAFEEMSPSHYNERWWQIRMENQGIRPPSNRSSPHLFDPAAKYHIAANVEYFRYFLSVILHFQFYESMCIAAGQYSPETNGTRPLFQCDFSGSKEAGKRLGDMMKLGFSEGWPVALEVMTGSREMSTTPMENYFAPLFEHIDKELAANGETPGFGGAC